MLKAFVWPGSSGGRATESREKNREREYAGSNSGAPKSFFQLKKRLPAPGNWRNMPFTGTVTGHDNWPISGCFWPVAWDSHE